MSSTVIIFKPKNKNIKCLNFRMGGQKIKLNKQVKYLGVILQDDLHWNSHLSNLEKKLSRAIGLLSKVRHYVSKYLYSGLYITLCLTYIWYMLVKYGVKTKIIHFFQEFQDYKKRLFVLLTSIGMIHPVIHSKNQDQDPKNLRFHQIQKYGLC